MSDLKNPAARLHALLVGVVAQGQSMIKPKPRDRVKASEVWTAYLGAENQSELLRKMASIYDLPSEIRRHLALIDIDAAPFVEPLESIEQVFTTYGLASQWDAYSRGIADTLMSSLKMCSALLDTRSPDPVLPEGSIDKIIAMARVLFDEVIGSTELDDDVRRFLAESLSDILRATDLYRISGVLPIEHAVDTTIGRYVRTKPDAQKSSLGKRVLGFVGVVALLLKVANDGHTAHDNFQDYLPWQVAPMVELVPPDLQQKALPAAPAMLEIEGD